MNGARAVQVCTSAACGGGTYTEHHDFDQTPQGSVMSTDVARHLMVDFTQMKTFAEDPLVLEHGEGIRLIDNRGRTYIDGLSGVFSSNMGHGNAEFVDALASQARGWCVGWTAIGRNSREAE